MMGVEMSGSDPNPFDDVRKGLGLLFRAARAVARKLPTKNLEEVVATSAREVGRAVENVAAAIEREVRNKSGSSSGRPSSDDKVAPSEPRDGEKPKPPDDQSR
jgi:hypothetical protein